MSAVLCGDSIVVNLYRISRTLFRLCCPPRIVFNNSLVQYKKTVAFNIPREDQYFVLIYLLAYAGFFSRR